MHVTGFNFVSFNFRFFLVSVRLNHYQFGVSVSFNFRFFFVSGITDIDSKLSLR